MFRAQITPDKVVSAEIVGLEFFDTLPLALVRAREAIMLHFRSMLRRYSLTEPQWRVLRSIEAPGAMDFSELSRMTALLLPSLSRIVRELELRGYIDKQTAPTDLRRMQVRLTPRGCRLVQLVRPDSETVISAMRTAVGSDKLRQIQVLLAEFEAKLSGLVLRFGESASIIPQDALIIPGKKRGRPRKKAG